ncbi:helix-turn-helix transcriptional regulator [Streptomyces sp. NPDC048606]|uniref:helix-turn-helix domain-containing protein n=1 Tax=Streptomyces sp. NPDC048606 TaxID=3154726 RepID=UPI003428304B
MASSPHAAIEEARKTLGARLREIRRRAGFGTARAFGARAGWSESKVSRLKNGVTSPSEEDLHQYASLSGDPALFQDLFATAAGIDEMFVEWRRLTENGLTPVQEAHVPLYDRTRLFRVYEPGVIPGLVQTPAYARALMGRIVGFYGIPDDADQAAELRTTRKREVMRDAGRHFVFVLEESALRARFGDTTTMADQLAHLMTVSVRQHVRLGVIPLNAQRAMWPSEGFWIFDDEQVVIELSTAQITLTQPSEVKVYARIFAELSRMAVYGSPARALISNAIDALE